MRQTEYTEILSAQRKTPLGDHLLMEHLRPAAKLLRESDTQVSLYNLAIAATGDSNARLTAETLSTSPNLRSWRDAFRSLDTFQKSQVTEAIRLVSRYFSLKKNDPHATLGDVLNLSSDEEAELLDFSQQTHPRRNVIQAAFVLALFSPDEA